MQTRKIKSYRWIFSLIIIITLVSGWLIIDSKKQKEPIEKKVAAATDQKIDTTININYNRLDNISYAIGKDYVEFYYFLDQPKEIRNNFAVISKADTPKLFQGLDEMHEIEIKPFYSSDKPFYILENVYPDHGTIASDYSIVIDPFEGAADYNMAKILYESNDIFNSGQGSKIWATKEGDIQVSTVYKEVYLDGGGRTDGYILIDFLSYDESKDKFVSVNTKHNNEIAKYLEEAKNTGRVDPLTDKEYSTIVNSYQDILNGKEESVFNNLSL